MFDRLCFYCLSYAAWKLVRELNPADVKGNIVVTPIANVAAFVEQHKTSRIDDLDMDTQFPGDAGGMASQMVAKLIYAEIRAHASLSISTLFLSSMMRSPIRSAKLFPAQTLPSTKRP